MLLFHLRDLRHFLLFGLHILEVLIVVGFFILLLVEPQLLLLEGAEDVVLVGVLEAQRLGDSLLADP